MFNTTVFAYQVLIGLYALSIPILLLLGVFWILIKVGKGFARSIRK